MDDLFNQYHVSEETRVTIERSISSWYQSQVVSGPDQPPLEKQLRLCKSYDPYQGANLLHIACIGGYMEFVKFTLDIGIDIHSLDDKKRNALHYALQPYSEYRSDPEQTELIKYLLDSGVNYNQKGEDGMTPMDILYGRRLTKMLEYIDAMSLR